MSKRPSLRDWWALIKRAFAAWVEDYAPSMGAALSYYTVFSLAPVLLIVISIAGLIFGAEAARGEIFGQLRGLMGVDAAKAIEDILTSVNKPTEGITATAIGIVLLFIGATTVFGELQDALDRIWRAPARDKTSGWWGLLRARLLSFGMILGIAFLLIVSLVLSAAIAALGKWWSGAFGSWEMLAQLVNLVFGYVVTTVGFAMIYKIMPRVKGALARRVAGRGRDSAAVYDRTFPDWPVHRQERNRVGLRCGGVTGYRLCLGLLLRPDIPARRRVHLGLCADLWLHARHRPIDDSRRRWCAGNSIAKRRRPNGCSRSGHRVHP